MRLEEKVAIVSGGGGGIGSAICHAFAVEGARIILTDIDVSKAASVKESIESTTEAEVSVVIGDITNPEVVEKTVKEAVSSYGKIDILVNNVGMGPHTPVEDLEKDEWDRVLEVNLTSFYLLSRAVLKYMRSQGNGAVVNMSSIAGRSYRPTYGIHYSASKSAILGLTRHLAKEYAPFGIRVNAISPGFVDTPFSRKYQKGKGFEDIVKVIPIGRVADPSEIASVVVFLCSEDSSYMTGANMDVNGGILMG